MEHFLSIVTAINKSVNTIVWEKIGLWLLIAVGIILTCSTKFFQVSRLGLWLKSTIGKLFKKQTLKHTKDKGSISPFQALCTALAATVGTGNIAGVASAIAIGGAGSVLWMWIAAFFGMMTNYAENVLGLYFRRRDKKGEWCGGAMYYLRDGFGKYKGCGFISKILAVLFACFAILASFGIGNMGQTNKIVANIQSAFPIQALQDVKLYGDVSLYALIIGGVLMVIGALIIIGGMKRVAAFAEKIVPFMVVLFVLGSLAVIGINYQNIGAAFSSIFSTAFVPKAAAGGTIGYLISTVITEGFKRGVYSNEAGLGSSVMVHSNSTETEPVKQGMWGIFEVFADTMIVCTMTALVVLTSGVYNLETGELASGLTDATLVAEAFNSVFSWGDIGRKFVAIAMFLFAFTTVLGWSHYGSKAVEYLLGAKAVIFYRIFFVCMICTGGLMTSSLAWDISDTFNGLMMLPNLIGVVSLCPLVVKITKNYIDRKVNKKDVAPLLNFDPEVQKSEEARMKAAESGD